MARSSPSVWRRRLFALASAALCALVLLAPLLPMSQQEPALADAIDRALQDAVRPVALQVDGYGVQSDRRLENGSRVFELSRQRSGTPPGRDTGGGV